MPDVSTATSAARAHARAYAQRGWAPVPIPERAKSPTLDEWQKLRLSPTDVDRVFPEHGNVGVLLGEPSGWLVDIDLDCPESVDLASQILPPTLVFGRASKPRSHYLYRSEGSRTEKFRDLPEPDLAPDGSPRLDARGRPRVLRRMLVELRSTGGQTVFPGSTHPSGEPVAFSDSPSIAPTTLPPTDLRTAVARLAAAALLRRHAPALLEAFLAAPTEPPAGAPEPVAQQISEWLGVVRERPKRHHRPEASTAFQAASARFNADHPPTWTRKGSKCPVCEGANSFKALPGDDSRWVCFHASHDGCGIESNDCWTGDALDLAAFAAGRSPIDHLRAEGYLVSHPRQPSQPPPPGDADIPPELRAFVGSQAAPAPSPAPAPADPPPARVLDIATGAPVAAGEPPPIGDVVWDRPLTRGYLSLCAILRIPVFRSRVLGDAWLEFDEMRGCPMLCSPAARRPVTDTDYGQIREGIEREFVDPARKNPTGLRFPTADIQQAVHQIANERRRHPVREYLSSLEWDGVPRIDFLAEDILGIARAPLVQSLIRRWFVSAVARPMDPGCKVDTVLILVGKQGCGKSTFFRTLASDAFFVDTPFDVSSKDAYMLLSRAWIVEWAELEAMQRARDSASIKAFISSVADTYRTPYARETVTVRRSCVIVGSTNEREFLADPTGARRYWPIEVGRIDLSLLAQQRDQLWAEAVAAYRAREEWHLSASEEAQLSEIHKEHEVRDAWEQKVIEFLRGSELVYTGDPITVSLLLEKAIQKPAGQWTKKDEMRVAAVLAREGYERRRSRGANGRAYHWVQKGSE